MKKYRDIRIQLADAALVHLAVRDGVDTVFSLIGEIFRYIGCLRDVRFA